MKNKIAILIGAALNERTEYYLELLNSQTNKDFILLFLSTEELEGKKFDFEWKWIQEKGATFLPNIRKMRHPIFRNELLLAAAEENLPYLLCWDAYQIPDPNLIEEHLKWLKKGYNVCGQYLRLHNRFDDYKDGDKFLVREPDFRDTGIAKKCNGDWRYDNNSSGVLKDYLAINGWSLKYCGGTAGDDVDLGMRLQRNGANFVYNPLAGMAKTQHIKLKMKYSKTSKHHDTNKFRDSSAWDMDTVGSDELMEDDFLQCYLDSHGIKRWRCKVCGEEGVIDSVHLAQYNHNNNITRTDAGMEEVANFLNGGTEFEF